MAAPLSADRLVRILRDEGLEVHEYRSWRTHNRNHKGAWGPINGVMIHHTVTRGTDSSVRLCYDGYSTLPGPLCHGVIAKDGSVHLVGNGRANHAGSGDDDVMADVVAERDLSTDNEANTDGNSRFYGFECINMGDGEDPWPDEQLEAIEKAAAAICREYGWSAKSVIGHLEWQPGKIDPKGFGMDWMRNRIEDRLSRSPENQEDADMAVSDEDAKKIAKAVAEHDDYEVPWESNNTHNQLRHAVASLWRQSWRTEAVVKANQAVIEELAKAVAATHEQVDADEIVRRIQERLDALQFEVTIPAQAEG